MFQVRGLGENKNEGTWFLQGFKIIELFFLLNIRFAVLKSDGSIGITLENNCVYYEERYYRKLRRERKRFLV